MMPNLFSDHFWRNQTASVDRKPKQSVFLTKRLDKFWKESITQKKKTPETQATAPKLPLIFNYYY